MEEKDVVVDMGGGVTAVLNPALSEDDKFFEKIEDEFTGSIGRCFFQKSNHEVKKFIKTLEEIIGEVKKRYA
jgi:uncharacterized protein YfaA (DUF2138 family)